MEHNGPSDGCPNGMYPQVGGCLVQTHGWWLYGWYVSLSGWLSGSDNEWWLSGSDTWFRYMDGMNLEVGGCLVQTMGGGFMVQNHVVVYIHVLIHVWEDRFS